MTQSVNNAQGYGPCIAIPYDDEKPNRKAVYLTLVHTEEGDVMISPEHRSRIEVGSLYVIDQAVSGFLPVIAAQVNNETKDILMNVDDAFVATFTKRSDIEDLNTI